MKNINPDDYYKERITGLSSTISLLKKKALLLSWLRLFSFLFIIALGWWLWPMGLVPAFAGIGASLLLFIVIVNRDLDNKTAIENNNRLLDICRNEQLAQNHQYYQFPDGMSYLDPHHAYAHDLDLFGHASLYQYINRTRSEQGARLLANWLLKPATNDEVNQRQQAVTELAQQPEWNEQLQSYGAACTITEKAEKQINEWMNEESRVIHHTGWKLTRVLFPAASLSWLLLYLMDRIPQSLFLSGLTILLAITFYITKKLMPAWHKLDKITKELESFSGSIRHIETASFRHERLISLQTAFTNTNGNKASQQTAALKKIMDRLDYRLNPVVFIPLSIFLCWDLQQVFALEKWKKTNHAGIRHWYASLAQMEAVCSFASLRFNHPDWVFPVLKQQTCFSATALGHPLIPEGKRVPNDFSSEGDGIINLVTGSNMAGKSTFLRSCGVNIVLAMAGAPVCARNMQLSPMRVMSSMRISDNLEESTSTFYAELKKLKAVIEAVNQKEKVFLLLDEILRGTNSGDRHTGSKALIRQLIAQQATGIVASHDLELAKLEADYPGQLINYHFDVRIANEELYFDYTLKEGVCQSMNASLLMKKIGINM
jgi:hypothetical protein